MNPTNETPSIEDIIDDSLEALLWGEHVDGRKAIDEAKALLEKRELKLIEEIESLSDSYYVASEGGYEIDTEPVVAVPLSLIKEIKARYEK